MPILSKSIYTLNRIPIKIPAGYFVEINKLIKKHMKKHRKQKKPKQFKKTKPTGTQSLYALRAFYKATVIKCQDKHTDDWVRI